MNISRSMAVGSRKNTPVNCFSDGRKTLNMRASNSSVITPPALRSSVWAVTTNMGTDCGLREIRARTKWLKLFI